jgi:uncharacterized protein YkwD
MRIGILSFVLVWLAGMAVADRAALAVINAERAAQGRAALSYDSRLEAAARTHAQDMSANGFMSHIGSDGSDLAKRLRRAGYKYCYGAENVAFGQQSLAVVMTAWMNSAKHRQNILNRKAKSVGLARATGDRWVMVLGATC